MRTLEAGERPCTHDAGELIEVRPLDEPLGRAAGELLVASRTSDVIDAALVLLADKATRL